MSSFLQCFFSTKQVSTTPELGYSGYRTPYHETGHHTVFMAQLSSPDTKPVSALEVQKKDKPLACDTEVEISIKYTVVGEKQGSATLMYLVSGGGSRPPLPQRHGHAKPISKCLHLT